MQTFNDVFQYLNSVANYALQEDYDNSGLIVGNGNSIIKSVLISLDCTEEVVDEAINMGCNLIVCHHPIVFRGLKRLNGANYVERVVIKAIKHDIGILAVHTNLDNVIHGVNQKIAQKLELKNLEILAPKSQALKKITTFIPKDYVEKVSQALHDAGAGQIGKYKNCAFRIEGKGTFTPDMGATPFEGEIGKESLVNEIRVEMIYPFYLEAKILTALKNSHPYEEVAYYINKLDNINQEIGAGLFGLTSSPFEAKEFLNFIKQKMDIDVIKHTKLVKDKIEKVAICGGSGSFLIPKAIGCKADIYITSDIKYHEFFDVDGQLIVADIGHYESEKFTNELLFELISNNFITFAVHLSRVNTNPIRFYY